LRRLRAVMTTAFPMTSAVERFQMWDVPSSVGPPPISPNPEGYATGLPARRPELVADARHAFRATEAAGGTERAGLRPGIDRFARDSPLEESAFEPLVPLTTKRDECR
jgi:hypothetical protein